MAAGLAIGLTAVRPQALGTKILNCRKTKWVFSPLAFSSSSSNSRKLILYSKPGCCLCDGLKEKLNAAFSLSTSHSLHDVQLQVRDITSNPEWEKAYQYEIPVLARVRPDGTEWSRLAVSSKARYGKGKRLWKTLNRRVVTSLVRTEVLPRLSPRLGVEAVHKKIAAAFTE
ncbi:uncharacterized protein [Nicotiana sylvestris]|uniref:Glutaredoxin-like protein n=1 Tax=Nicotiana sylvestris TaxID=4096 RepID=A0A1U7YHN9_NICSY|nr:PREDICTED: uncharacterized protein LOC104248141 [Nicotiana sylvestris]